MQFINAAVDIGQLPRAGDIELQPVHNSYLKVLRIEWLITAIVLASIAAALVYFVDRLRDGYGWLIVAGAALLMMAIHRLLLERNFPFLAYAVREKDVITQRGWLVRTIKICPTNRIQNCSLQSGPLERKFHLATLTIYTAGSDNADLRIPGLPQEEADKLRHYILEKIHAEDHEGL